MLDLIIRSKLSRQGWTFFSASTNILEVYNGIIISITFIYITTIMCPRHTGHFSFLGCNCWQMMTMIPCFHHLRLLEPQQSLLYSATDSFLKYILQMKTARWEEMTGISGSSSPIEVRRKYSCTEVLQRHRCISTVHRCHHCHRCTSTSTYFAKVIQLR